MTALRLLLAAVIAALPPAAAAQPRGRRLIKEHKTAESGVEAAIAAQRKRPRTRSLEEMNRLTEKVKARAKRRVRSGKGSYGNIEDLRRAQKNAMEKVTRYHEKLIPDEARRPDGSVDAKHPEYRKVRERHENMLERVRQNYNKKDKRWGELQQTLKKHGLDGDFINTGSAPKNAGSDIDLTPKNYGKNTTQGHIAVKKLGEAWRKDGHIVVDMPDRIINLTSDTTVWKPTRPEQTGSSAYDAQVHYKTQHHSDMFPTEGGMHSTTGGAVGIRDPEGAVVSNLKKAADAGITGKPGDMDLHTAGKSVTKAMDAAGTAKRNPGLYEKAMGVRNHKTPEQAGIYNIGDSPEAKARKLAEFQGDMRRELKRAYGAAARESKSLNAKRKRVADKAFKSGRRDLGVTIREQQIRAEASNRAALTEIGRMDPALLEEVAGTDPRKPRDLNKMRDQNREAARKLAAGPEEGPRPGAPVERRVSRLAGAAAEAGAAAKKWGGKANQLIGYGGTAFGAYDSEMQAALDEGRDPSQLRMAGYALWEMTGIPGAMASVNEGLRLRDEELAKADAKYGANHWGVGARVRAAGRALKGMAQWDTGTQIAEEEIAREQAQALKEGREPNYYKSWGVASLRGLGTVIGVSRIADAATKDWDAEFRLAATRQAMDRMARARLQENVETIEHVRQRMREVLAEADPDSEAVKARLDALMSMYGEAREQLARTAKKMREQLGPNHPAVQGLYGALKDVPSLDEVAEERAGAEADEKAAEKIMDPKDREPIKGDPGINEWIPRAEAAAAACDYPKALRLASWIDRRDNTAAWLDAHYAAIRANAEKQTAAREAMGKAESLLARSHTEAAAEALAPAAQSAPPCMAGDIAAIADRIKTRDDEIAREREAKERARAKNRTPPRGNPGVSAGAVSTLIGILQTVNRGRATPRGNTGASGSGAGNRPGTIGTRTGSNTIGYAGRSIAGVRCPATAAGMPLKNVTGGVRRTRMNGRDVRVGSIGCDYGRIKLNGNFNPDGGLTPNSKMCRGGGWDRDYLLSRTHAAWVNIRFLSLGSYRAKIKPLMPAWLAALERQSLTCAQERNMRPDGTRGVPGRIRSPCDGVDTRGKGSVRLPDGTTCFEHTEF